MLGVMDDKALTSVLRLTKALVNRRMTDYETKKIVPFTDQDANESDQKGNASTKHDPQLLSDLQTLINLYIKTGTFRFSEIIKDFYSETGSKLEHYFTAIKVLYSAYYTLEATDTEAAKMDSNLRTFTFESILSIYSLPYDEEKPDPQPVIPIEENLEVEDDPEDFLGWIGESWIDYIKEHHKGYYKELKKAGTLHQVAIQKEKEYYDTVDQLKSKYPPGGAEEVARMFLYPKLNP